MINTIIITIIFIALSAIKYFVKSNDFSKNYHLYYILANKVCLILGDNLIKYIRTGSTSCGISIGSSDVDIGIIVRNVNDALIKLEKNGFIVTKKYDHFINLTQSNNHIDYDVKIYIDHNELNRLENSINVYAKSIGTSERYWLMSEKIWYNLTKQFDAYERAKIIYYKKHNILK